LHIDCPLICSSLAKVKYLVLSSLLRCVKFACVFNSGHNFCCITQLGFCFFLTLSPFPSLNF